MRDLQTGTTKLCCHIDPGYYENISGDVLDLDELEVLGAPPSLGTRLNVVCSPVAGDCLSAFYVHVLCGHAQFGKGKSVFFFGRVVLLQGILLLGCFSQ